MVEPMSVGFHAVARAMVTEVDTVMVIGCGMVGLGAVVGAASRGARVIAADIDKADIPNRKSASTPVFSSRRNLTSEAHATQRLPTSKPSSII